MVRRVVAALVLLWSLFFWILGISSLVNGLIGLTTGKAQWVQVGNTTIAGLGALFGVGVVCIALGYGLGRAGLYLWRNVQAERPA
jgi:hypothetical protein